MEHPYKFHTERVNSWPRWGVPCKICKKDLNTETRFAVRGEAPSSSIWLRGDDDNALYICESEMCFNMILLDVYTYIRLPY
jgi:hypothetical protein